MHIYTVADLMEYLTSVFKTLPKRSVLEACPTAAESIGKKMSFGLGKARGGLELGK